MRLITSAPANVKNKFGTLWEQSDLLWAESFRWRGTARMFRTYWRQRRAEHVRGTATCIQRMQEALTQMNVQLANVISDISGLTGRAIMRAIVARIV